jgi:putative ABC transport system permease protein
MFKNYLKVALRTILRQKGYALINIFGLAVGMACCILILLHVQDELKFDRFHSNFDRIYRVVEIRSSPERGDRHTTYSVPPLGPALVTDFPGVERASRLFAGFRLTVKQGENRQIVRNYFFSDQSFFEIFDFPFLHGQPALALTQPRSIVLTRTSAMQFFGEENVVGRTLSVEAEDFPEFGIGDFIVTGVVADPPHNSHIDFKLLLSMNTLDQFDDWRRGLESWTANFVTIYLQLAPSHSLADLQAKFPEFSAAYRGEDAWKSRKIYLQPLEDVHFGSAHIQFENNQREGEILYVYVFAGIALLIVLIACINYMNLATARSMSRAREVGIRKVVGAVRMQMIGQYLSESLFTAALSLAVAIGLVELVLPSFNALAGKQLNLGLNTSGPVLLGMLALVLLIGIASGSYPAFYLSKIRPVGILKGAANLGIRQSRLRQILVTTQFTLSIVMIIVTILVHNQVEYMRSKALGFNKDRLIVIDINHDDVQSNFASIKTELARNSAVSNVSVSSRVPGDWKSFRQIQVLKPGGEDGERQAMYFNGIDEDFLDTYEIELVQGRNFGREMADSAAVILNESAAKHLFQDSPIGKPVQIASHNFEGRVIGIVKDFHYHSLHSEISPLVIGLMPYSGSHVVHGIDYFTLRVSGSNIPETIDFITRVHDRFDGVNPIEYAFLDGWLHDLYQEDERVGRIFGISAGLAILIACVGLFGLSAFMAEQRTKEIGVRKVLGASTASIVSLLSKDFSKLVVLGLIAASPIAYFAIDQWLSEFAYRISIGAWPCLLAGAIAVLIALGTVSYQSIKAAVSNPVKSLRYE